MAGDARFQGFIEFLADIETAETQAYHPLHRQREDDNRQE
jgi:hypothetical protein